MPGVSTVRRKYLQAVKGADESGIYFEELTANAPKKAVRKWKAELSEAQINRLKKLDAMDILDVKSEQGAKAKHGIKYYLTCDSFKPQPVQKNN